MQENLDVEGFSDPSMSPARFESRSDCPACGTPGQAAFSRSYGEPTQRAPRVAFCSDVGGLDYPWLEGAQCSVSKCLASGSWFQSSIPSEATLRKLYEEWTAPDTARLRFHDELAPRVFLARVREVQVAISLVSAGTPRGVGKGSNPMKRNQSDLAGTVTAARYK